MDAPGCACAPDAPAYAFSMKGEVRRLDLLLLAPNGDVSEVWFAVEIDERTRMILDYELRLFPCTTYAAESSRTLH